MKNQIRLRSIVLAVLAMLSLGKHQNAEGEMYAELAAERLVPEGSARAERNDATPEQKMTALEHWLAGPSGRWTSKKSDRLYAACSPPPNRENCPAASAMM